MTALDESLLVEAGPGSGKTAVMAGRIVMLLAAGVEPKKIAAITFTELAASQLAERVVLFLEEVIDGRVRPDLTAALPDGPTLAQSENLRNAHAALDQLTATTIHGFCQRLIKPYPIEAHIDPGARIIDPTEVELVFQDILDQWLRERLSGEPEDDDLLAELILAEPARTLKLITEAGVFLKKNRTAAAPPSPPFAGAVAPFREAVDAFHAFLSEAGCSEPGTEDIVAGFEELADHFDAAIAKPSEARQLSGILFSPRPRAYIKSQDKFATYKKKGKWQAAAKGTGLSKAEGERLNGQATLLYEDCCAAHDEIKAPTAGRVLERLVQELREPLQRYQAYKTTAALLDFDDLLQAARDLLQKHEPVRRALGEHYAHVLVDEFQDTDPLQCEIVWRLAGNPPAARDEAVWSEWTIRPGALLLVGDPKQAIYRFRGADVGTYLKARQAIGTCNPKAIVEISTNFRSLEPILEHVNARFCDPLSTDGQPGFTSLDAFHAADGDGPFVAAMDIAVPAGDGGSKPKAGQIRDAEAEAAAAACRRLIGSHQVRGEDGNMRACCPGDIALLAPGGTELWRYEQALEDCGIPVSTQAGKGFFRRQEIQDLIAVTRVLADGRDRLALGAYLRGPLLGLSEEALLDTIDALPSHPDRPESLPRLSIRTPTDDVRNDLTRWALDRLQPLARKARSTTPYRLLSEAVEELRVRPLLRQRHRGNAERALANVDLFLEMARAYDVRGLTAFARDMQANWEEARRTVEGRPDAEEQAVSLITMHAAKGLEWPVVMPINTGTGVMAPEQLVYDRAAGLVRFPVFGVRPDGHEEAHEAENAESARENVRLWYVATTRARDLLLLPRFDCQVPGNAWISLVDLGIGELPAFDLMALSDDLPPVPAEPRNDQDRARFEQEAGDIADLRREIAWRIPSRHDADSPPLTEEIRVYTDSDQAVGESEASVVIQGGRERGLVLHKLMEEVLTGETADDPSTLEQRAEALIRELGLAPTEDPAEGPSPSELTATVARTLALREVATVRVVLVPESPVHAAKAEDGRETIISGVADAFAVDASDKVELVIDWKSDVAPNDTTIALYRSQIGEYLAATGAAKGLIVFMTSGRVIEVGGGAMG